MSERQEQLVASALEKVFRHFNDKVGPLNKDRRTHDFVFHMTDWYSDLVVLAELYQHPEGHTQDEWNDGVVGFLYHAVGHLMAAAQINDTFSDPFKAAPHLAGATKKVIRRSSKRKATRVKKASRA